MRQTPSKIMLQDAQVRAIVDSTNASPINVQVTGHGFQTGDEVTIFGHTTNTAANGSWKITRVDANNFTLDGSTGNGVGGATGCAAPKASPLLASDAEHITLSIDTDGGGDAAMTIKIVGSRQELPPDFAAAQAKDNQYEYLEVIDLEDGAAIDGDTGFAVATADDHRAFEVNVNGMRWISVVATAGTAGEVTVVGTLHINV